MKKLRGIFTAMSAFCTSLWLRDDTLNRANKVYETTSCDKPSNSHFHLASASQDVVATAQYALVTQ